MLFCIRKENHKEREEENEIRLYIMNPFLGMGSRVMIL